MSLRDYDLTGAPFLEEAEPSRDQMMATMYRSVRRKPAEGTAMAAIKVHAQACGLVAYVFNVHPDAVARAVRDSG